MYQLYFWDQNQPHVFYLGGFTPTTGQQVPAHCGSLPSCEKALVGSVKVMGCVEKDYFLVKSHEGKLHPQFFFWGFVKTFTVPGG